jgi:hypothetical protein
MEQRLVRGFLAGMLALGSLTGVACDKEDERDAREFGNQVEEGAEDIGNEVEDTVDDEVDTDGKDD